MSRYLALGWLALAALAAWATQGLGFPDGHLTELDRARAVSWPATTAVSLLGAALTAAFGDRAPRASAAALGLMLAAALGVDMLLTATLDHGGGG
jgi:hypothetical protein